MKARTTMLVGALALVPPCWTIEMEPPVGNDRIEIPNMGPRDLLRQAPGDYRRAEDMRQTPPGDDYARRNLLDTPAGDYRRHLIR